VLHLIGCKAGHRPYHSASPSAQLSTKAFSGKLNKAPARWKRLQDYAPSPTTFRCLGSRVPG